jgi:hypothetical protein
MTSASVESAPWGRRRWWAVVALVFIVQLALIFWLGGRAPTSPRQPTTPITLRLDGPAPTKLEAFDDPTLFILPHPEAFSGPVWGRTPRQEFHRYEWSDSAKAFSGATNQLGAAFSQLFQTSESPTLRFPAQVGAAPTLPSVPPLANFASQSALELEGDLAQRHLRAPLELRSWTNTDILASSVVQVGVDAGGRPVSAILLSRSGSPAADQCALDLAWAARFEPLGGSPTEVVLSPTPRLTWGQMVFRWRTVPMPPGSAQGASP